MLQVPKRTRPLISTSQRDAQSPTYRLETRFKESSICALPGQTCWRSEGDCLDICTSNHPINCVMFECEHIC